MPVIAVDNGEQENRGSTYCCGIIGKWKEKVYSQLRGKYL